MIKFSQRKAPYERLEVLGEVDMKRYISIEESSLREHPELKNDIKKKLTMDLKNDMLKYVFQEDGFEAFIRSDDNVRELMIEAFFRLRGEYSMKINENSKHKDYIKLKAIDTLTDYLLRSK